MRSLALAATLVIAASAATAGPLDGTWATVIQCPTEPGGGAGYVWRFSSAVRANHLHGQYGTPGQPASLTIDGDLGADGSGTLSATGLAGNPKFNINNVVGGTPIGHRVSVRLEGRQGSGERLSGRSCHYAFSKR